MKKINYKLSLYLNIIKYRLRNLFKSIDKNENINFLKEYFKSKKDGFYIDVGCYHPIRLSNTMFLYSKGWSGMNVDLSKKSIDLFNICRPRDINLNFGIGSKNYVSSYFYNKEIFHSNTLDINFSKDFLKKDKLRKKKIKIKTLSYLIDKYLLKKKIDLIDIDAEGLDFDVLKGINFKKHSIDLIMVEIHDYDKKTLRNSKKIQQLLKKNNFKLIYGNFPGNCIFKCKK